MVPVIKIASNKGCLMSCFISTSNKKTELINNQLRFLFDLGKIYIKGAGASSSNKGNSLIILYQVITFLISDE